MPKGFYIRTPETKIKMSLTRKGKKLSEETKRKISESSKKRPFNPKFTTKGMIPWNKGKKLKFFSDEHRRKMSRAAKGSQNWKKRINYKHSEETKKKMRLAAIKYIEKKCGGCRPNLGNNEKQILDELEIKLGYRIIRQYKVGGYYLDGYIPEINLAIEVDEKYHKKRIEKDVGREEFIKAKLGCEFLRIKDYN